MNTETAAGGKPGDSDKDSLMNAHREIQELALLFSLGKAEAMDKFEEIRNEFRGSIQKIRRSLNEATDQAVTGSVLLKLDALELTLSGKVDSVTVFEKQKEKLLAALLAFENEALSAIRNHDLWRSFLHETEKFKLKMEIVRLRLVLKKFELKEGYESLMKDVRDKLERLTFRRRRTATDNFKAEMSEAYGHIRKAIAGLK